MPLPHLYIFHPHESRGPHLVGWLAEVQEVLRGDANWDGSELHRVSYDLQAGFNVGTEVDRVRRNPGPAIFIQKVQARLFNHFRIILSRTISIYSIDPATSDDIYAVCEEARKAYDDGEPRIPLRELVAYLIIAKLARHDMWGGAALNKNFLWAHDLPKGGFPKDVCTNRDIMEVADALFNAGVLTGKKSQGKFKYALGDRTVINPILNNREFPNQLASLRNYFDRSTKHVSARLLSYNEE